MRSSMQSLVDFFVSFPIQMQSMYEIVEVHKIKHSF